MDDKQKNQTLHMLPRGKATAKFREQHAKPAEDAPSPPAGQYKLKQPAANTNGFSGSVEQQLEAVLADRLKWITSPKTRKAIEESVREEALKKLAQIMPGEVMRAVDASIAEISRSMGVVVPGRPTSPPPYPGTASPSSHGGKSSSPGRSRGHGGK